MLWHRCKSTGQLSRFENLSRTVVNFFFPPPTFLSGPHCPFSLLSLSRQQCYRPRHRCFDWSGAGLGLDTSLKVECPPGKMAHLNPPFFSPYQPSPLVPMYTSRARPLLPNLLPIRHEAVSPYPGPRRPACLCWLPCGGRQEEEVH